MRYLQCGRCITCSIGGWVEEFWSIFQQTVRRLTAGQKRDETCHTDRRKEERREHSYSPEINKIYLIMKTFRRSRLVGSEVGCHTEILRCRKERLTPWVSYWMDGCTQHSRVEELWSVLQPAVGCLTVRQDETCRQSMYVFVACMYGFVILHFTTCLLYASPLPGIQAVCMLVLGLPGKTQSGCDSFLRGPIS